MASRRKGGIVLMAFGAALLLGALSLFAWSRWDEARASASVAEVMEQLKPQVGSVEAEKDDPLPRVLVGENYYIGYLDVPVLGLELPVMTTWSYDQLRVAPCRYYGSVESGDLVIAGYGYPSHFSRLVELHAGDDVRFVGMDGTEYAFVVAEVGTLPDTAVDELTAGECALTLFTCSDGGTSSVFVRCDGA